MKIYIPFSIYMEIYKPFRLLGNRHLILCVILLHDILYKYTYCTNTRIVQIRINTYILLRLLETGTLYFASYSYMTYCTNTHKYIHTVRAPWKQAPYTLRHALA